MAKWKYLANPYFSNLVARYYGTIMYFIRTSNLLINIINAFNSYKQISTGRFRPLQVHKNCFGRKSTKNVEWYI